MFCECFAERGSELGRELRRRLELDRCPSLEEKLEVLRAGAGEYIAFTWARAEGGARLSVHGGMFFHAIKHTHIERLRQVLCSSLRSFVSSATECRVSCLRCGERCEMLVSEVVQDEGGC
ncbi:MAG: hypothetical protein GXN98_00545 [Euryarchaeota archaeon]|nr:hypothetical protein [Euryarchaeota archaeon]